MNYQYMEKTIFVAVGVLAFTITGVFGTVGNTLLASEKVLTLNSEADSFELRIVGDHVYGHFLNQPLLKLLDKINSQSRFNYYASQKLLEYQVSGTFDGTSLSATLKTILLPFNYIIAFGEAGEDTQLFLISTKDSAAEAKATNSSFGLSADGKAAENLQLFLSGIKYGAEEKTTSSSLELAANKHLISSVSLAEAKFLNSEFVLMEESDHTPSLPPDFENQQLDPKSNKENAHELPNFDPFLNSTGPIDPSLNTDDLPDFDPYYSENGPFVP